MSTKKIFALFALVLTAALIAACAGTAGPPGPEGPPGPAGPAGEAGVADITCTQCHDDTSLITGKRTAWSESRHGSGEAYARGTNASCAGCHSGGGFSARIAAGLDPTEVEEGDPNPTRQDCRTCHNIHTTYTRDDFSLETTDPVSIFAIEGVTFDGGEGNLCVNCHQPRRAFAAEGGVVNVDSTHWGPHHGPQSTMLIGVGGAGDVSGSPSAHASVVEDTCVTCHLGPDRNHSFEPVLAACQECHADVEDFDVNGVQTEVDALLGELSAALFAKGMVALDEDLAPEADYLVASGLLHTGHPHAVPGDYPEAEAAALWNFIYINNEDKSHGVHNSTYTIALLEASIEALQ